MLIIVSAIHRSAFMIMLLLHALMLLGLVGLSSAAEQSCPGSSVLQSTGLGGDGIYKVVQAETYQDCCSLCTANPACRSWTFHGEAKGEIDH